MEPKFQSSFIPKGPVGTSGASASFAPQKSRSLFGYVSICIFVVCLLLTAGTFGYNEYLLYRIGALGASLDAAQKSLMPDEITNITHADARLSATRTILAQHIGLSQLFNDLANVTEKNVAFSQFTYQTTDKGPTLSMTGAAASYMALKIQSDRLMSSSTPFLKNQSFTNLTLDTKGNVDFGFTADVDSSYFLYQNEFSSTSPAVLPTMSTSTTALLVATSTATSTRPALVIATTQQKLATTTAPSTSTH